MKQPDGLQPLRLLPAKIARELKTTFASLNNRDFRVYSWGQVISLCGTWMQTIALSWLVYKLTGSAAALGMVSFASSLPLLLFTYFGGILADRYDRKRILVTAQILGMVEATVLTALCFTGLISVTWLVVLALVRGTITAFELPARQSFLPDLVGKDQLTNAIGINSAIWNTSRTLGPALAGILIGAFGETLCFGINAVSYLAGLLSLSMLSVKVREKPTAAEQAANEKEAKRSVWSVLMDPKIKYVLLLSAATSIFGFQYGVLLPVVSDQVLGGAASTLGFLSAASGLGALFGSLVLANRSNSPLVRRGLGFACLVLACAVATIGYSTMLMVSLLAIGCAGAAVSFQLSGGNSLVQSSVNPALRGRVMGLYSTFMLGFSPFAAMLAGWLAELIGVSYTLYVSAACVFVSALLYLTFGKRSFVPSEEKK
ncbi:MAG: MFS transporter [Candidatus Melainabacteria bacterium]|nr:MFS transporter [Candidatus Melainabacteria bacterium]